MPVDPDPLDGLEKIDWAALRHAYGPASDVPGQLRAVATGDPENRQKALWELSGNIHHQGTVYQASAHAVPFLARLVESDSMTDEDRARLIALIAAIASGTSDDQAAGLEWVTTAHEAVMLVAPSLLAFLDGTRPALTWSLVDLAAQVPEAARDIQPTLRTMAYTPLDPMRRKALELALALIEGTVDENDIRAVASLGEDYAPLARPERWGSPAEGAKYIVTVLVEEAGAET